MYDKHLETFIQVADAGSFSKAADNLYISTTAIIKQINLLEEDLELQLFQRTHRGIRLTKAGESLYSDAKYIIQYAQDSLGRARQTMVQNDMEQTIRVGTSLMTPSKFLVELWPRIQEIEPGLKLQVVPYENTPENAREILTNLGQNIDVVAGIFDDLILRNRKCSALELSKEPIRCALSIHHPLASKKKLRVHDLYGESMMLLERGYFSYIDILRDDLWQKHPRIKIVDFPFYNVNAFNQCENSGYVLMAMDHWEDAHPLIKVLPVDWNYVIPFGLLHNSKPTDTVQRFLQAVKQVLNLE